MGLGGVMEQHTIFSLVVMVAWPRLIEAMKGSKLWIFSWLDEHTKIKNRVLGAVGALVAVGFSMHLEGSAIEGGKLVLAWPPINDIGAFVAAFATQFNAQVGVYHAVKSRDWMDRIQLKIKGNLKPQEPPKS